MYIVIAVALGAVLAQEHDDIHHPVAYASRTLTPAEKTQYSHRPTLLEALAVHFACVKFKHYLYGTEFVVVVDHLPLVQIWHSPSSNNRLAQWMSNLSDLSFKLLYRRGIDHQNVDALSRNFQEQYVDLTKQQKSEEITEKTKNERICYAIRKGLPPDLRDLAPKTIQELISAQRADPFCAALIRYLEDPADLPAYPPKAQKVVTMSENYLFNVRGLLCKRVRDHRDHPRDVIYVPELHRTQIMSAYHSDPTGGHSSAAKTVGGIMLRYFWPAMRAEIQAYCDSCMGCAMRKPPTQYPREALVPLPVPFSPMTRLHIDILGDFRPPSWDGNLYILTISDDFTKFSWTFALPN